MLQNDALELIRNNFAKKVVGEQAHYIFQNKMTGETYEVVRDKKFKMFSLKLQYVFFVEDVKFYQILKYGIPVIQLNWQSVEDLLADIKTNPDNYIDLLG